MLLIDPASPRPSHCPLAFGKGFHLRSSTRSAPLSLEAQRLLMQTVTGKSRSRLIRTGLLALPGLGICLLASWPCSLMSSLAAD